MKIVEATMPKFLVTFNHPDDSSRSYEFFVQDDNVPSVFCTEDEMKEWHNKMGKEVWNTYNSSGYYHTMTISSEFVIDGKVYHPVIFDEVSRFDLMD